MCPLTIESLHQNVEEQDNSIAYQKMAFEAIFWYTFFFNVYCIIFSAMPWDFEPQLV